MILLRNKIPADPFKHGVTPEEIIARDAPGSLQATIAYMEEERKACQQAQGGRSEDGGLERKLMEIPAVMFSRIPPEQLRQDTIRKTMCNLWHEFPAFRRVKGNCPFCRRK